jgi:predicted DNA-binding transcriptional regulator YafY
MRHPTTRVLALLELLQSQARMNGAELAARLEVDRRTLRRYIATLEDIGIPILAERGRHGGYALMPGFKLPPMMFTDDEALALSLGLLAARGLGLAESAPASASARSKLERLMPAQLQHRVRAIGETVKLDLPEAAAPSDKAVFVTLSSAALSRHQVRLHYRTADGRTTERTVDPYGLAFHAGCWYAVGQCHLRQGVRTFRLDRIVQAGALAKQFARPTGFDVLHHLRQSVATLPRAFAVEVLLKTGLTTARGLAADALGLLEQTDAGVILHNQSDDLGWLARQLAALPVDFEVRKPQQLCDELTTLAQRLLRCAQPPQMPAN